MLQLSSSKPISSGGFRDCYLHPENPGICIKVVSRRSSETRAGWRERILGRKNVDPNVREFDEYRRHQAAGVPLNRYFPRMLGWVATDLGRGLCVEYLRGTDLLPPVSIVDYLDGNRALGELDNDFIIQELDGFAMFCARHAILAACDEMHNIGFIRQGSGHRLVCWDLKRRMNKQVIPLESLFIGLRRNKVARRFRKHINYVQQRLS